jgi:hypothetical protein
MEQIIVQYKVKAGRIAENEAHINKVFEQLREREPSGIRYASFKLRDGVSILHFVSVETTDGSNPLCDLPAFKEFTASASERLDGPPVVTHLNEFRSYRFFSDASFDPDR